jgi:hypothetical protein
MLIPETSLALPIAAFNDFNDTYNNLDDNIKSSVDKIPTQKHKEEFLQKMNDPSVPDNIKQDLLRNANDPELAKIYNKLGEKSKKTIDELPIRDKFLMLRQQQKKKATKEPVIKAPVIKEPIKEPIKAPVIKEPIKAPIKDADIDAPSDLFAELEDKYRPDKNNTAPQEQFRSLVYQFYASNPYTYSPQGNPELEVRFGTRGIKPLTVTDYDNVIRKLKSLGFSAIDVNGQYSLRVNCEYLDSFSGKVKMSDIRTEINGLHNIQKICENNDLKQIYMDNPSCVKFQKKKMVINSKKEKLFPVNIDDFNFRVSFSNEETVKKGVQTFIIENWKKSKKTFRYLNRVTFKHDDYPFNVDISIVKYADKKTDKYGNEGRGDMVKVYNVSDSNVFNNPEVYEIEIEVDNEEIGPGTKFNSPTILLASLKKVIKFILSGLQGTNYPVSYPEQREVLNSYMKMIWGDEYNPKKRVTNRNFLGPSSKTVQLENICSVNPDSLEPNIRKSFVVTEKADGMRNLMFITDVGKIYLIDMNMNVIFTGAKTNVKENFNCLMDGELIATNKKGEYINLYAAFDIYFYANKDVRSLTFMLLDTELEIYNARYQILKLVTNSLKPTSIMDTYVEPENKMSMKSLLSKFKEGKKMASPIRITSKEFYPYSNKQTIFQGCHDILTKVDEGRFEYETDGLIFTHAYFGVGADKIGVSGGKFKKGWDHSFKWKPPKMNTIDFLITTIKGANGEDVIKPIFADGINTDASVQHNEYKTIELRCGFNEYKDGYVNPCQDIIDDKLPEKEKDDNFKYDIQPMRFYPTEPYDINAGITKIMLKPDANGKQQMFTEEFDVFTDNTIVEFSYELTGKEGWRWVPLRVRHDKTTEYRQGNKQYGNAYATANNNWKSIHFPVTETMIRTGKNIPDVLINEDIYYNTPSGSFMTQAMKNFHNLYVKKMLIKNVSKPGDNLIDFACGKGGDLAKWTDSKLSFVFGVDISKDNLENRLNGACARYLNAKKEIKNVPHALFVNGNSAFNIKNGSAMMNDKAAQITKAVFGIGSKDPNTIGKGVARQYGVGDTGFNISSCQFAIHYFFENPSTLQGFLKNVAECTKLNGYFIGTAYDGKEVFNLLNTVKTGESVKIIEHDKKIWEIVKDYGPDVFNDDSSSIGYKISVFQESINQHIVEYLVNFNYLCRIFEMYGFKVIGQEEAKELQLPSGTGLFSQLYDNMVQEISRNKFKEKDYGKASQMTSMEKKISFLNRYFVFKKLREVNTDKIELEMSEYNAIDLDKNKADTIHAEKIAKKTNAVLKPKIKKLDTKLVLVPASEAVVNVSEQKQEEQKQEEQKQEEPKKIKRKKASTKKLVLES